MCKIDAELKQSNVMKTLAMLKGDFCLGGDTQKTK